MTVPSKSTRPSGHIHFACVTSDRCCLPDVLEQLRERDTEIKRLRAELKVARRTISHAARAYPGVVFSNALERMEAVRNG